MYFTIIISCLAALAGLLFGYDTGVISGALLFITPTFHLSTFMSEVIVSAVIFGACLGALLSGYLGDRFCRRYLLIWAALAFILGTACCTIAQSPLLLIIGRFTIGLAIGSSSYVTPLYIAEMAPPKYRGALVTINVIMITGGIVIAYLCNYFLASVPQAWRWMLGLGAIPACLLLLGTKLLPPSPRWLLKQGHVLEARKVLAKISPTPQATLQAIADNLARNHYRGHWRDFIKPEIRFLLCIGCGLSIMQQTCGINAILYYAPILFRTLGLANTQTQLLATIGVGLVNFIMTIVALLLVERMGRRKLLLLGFGAMTLCLGQISLGLYLHSAHSLFLLVNLVGFIMSYAISIGCIFWIVIAEIFPLQLRSTAMSIATTTNWLSNGLVSLSFLTLLNSWGPALVFAGFTLSCLLSWLFCYRYLPETKGASLEQLENYFTQIKPPAGNKDLDLSPG